MSKYVQLNLFDLGGSAASVFKIFPPEAHTGDLRDRIELAGGIVLEPDEEDPHAVPLIDIKWLSEQAEELLNKSHIPSESFFSTFIYDCYEWERLFDLNPYRVGNSKYFPYDANEVLQRRLSWPELRLKPVFEPISAEKLKSQYETPRKRRNLHDNSLDRTIIEIDQEQDTGIIPTGEAHQDLEGVTDDPDMDASMNLNPVSVEIRHDEELVLRRIESEEDDAALSDVECIPATPKTPKTLTKKKPRKNQSPRNPTKVSPKNTSKAPPKNMSNSSPKNTPKASPKNTSKAPPKNMSNSSPKNTPKASPKNTSKASLKNTSKASPKNKPKGNQNDPGSSVGLAKQINGTPASSSKECMTNGSDMVVENETEGIGSSTCEKSGRSSGRKHRQKSRRSPSNIELGEESSEELTTTNHYFSPSKSPISIVACNGQISEDDIIVNDLQDSVQNSESDQQQRSRKSSRTKKNGENFVQEEVEDEMETSHLVDNTETSVSAQESANDHDVNTAEDINNDDVNTVEDINNDDVNTAEDINSEEADVEVKRTRKSKKKSQHKRQKKLDEDALQVETDNLSPSRNSTFELKESTSVPSETPSKKTSAKKSKGKVASTVMQNGEKNLSSPKSKKSEHKRKKNAKEILDPSDVPEMSQNEPEVSKVPRKTPKKTKKSKNLPISLDADAPTEAVAQETAHPSSSTSYITTKRVVTSVESSDSGFYPSKRRRKSMGTSESNSSSSSMLPLQLPPTFSTSSSEDSSSESTSKSTKKKEKKNKKKSSKTGKSFTCSSCPFTTSEELNLVHHMRLHTGEIKFQCTYCSFSATGKSSLKKHQKLHSQGRGQLCCIMCDFTTSDPSQLQAHCKSHDDTKTYECPSCSFKASTAYKLRVHRTKTHPEL